MEGWAQPGNKRPKAKNPLANNAQFFLAAFILKGFFYWFDSNKRRILDSFCFLRSMWLVVLSLGLCNRSAVQSQKERTKKSTEILTNFIAQSVVVVFFSFFDFFLCILFFVFLKQFFLFLFFSQLPSPVKALFFLSFFLSPSCPAVPRRKKRDLSILYVMEQVEGTRG